MDCIKKFQLCEKSKLRPFWGPLNHSLQISRICLLIIEKIPSVKGEIVPTVEEYIQIFANHKHRISIFSKSKLYKFIIVILTFFEALFLTSPVVTKTYEQS